MINEYGLNIIMACQTSQDAEVNVLVSLFGSVKGFLLLLNMK